MGERWSYLLFGTCKLFDRVSYSRVHVQLFRVKFPQSVFPLPHESVILYFDPFDIYAKWKYVQRAAHGMAVRHAGTEKYWTGIPKVSDHVESPRCIHNVYTRSI